MSDAWSASRPRPRELGLSIGRLPPGPLNALTDVDGVRVGHATVCFGDGPLRPGEGPARTGVTVILPHGGDLYRRKSRAAVRTINGYGKAFGFEQVRELGVLESPIALTNTFNVGLVADSLVRWAISRDAAIGSVPGSGSLNVLVGETNDGWLNDLAGRHVRHEQVLAAVEAALSGPCPAPVEGGSVGAGTGTSCFGWKGGIGTSSRLVEAPEGRWTLGALVQSNFGNSSELTILGVPVGRSILPPKAGEDARTAPGGPEFAEPPERGSIMIVLATDAPLSDRQLGRLCVRAAAALARTGGSFGHGSGDFVVAFTTANPVEHAPSSPISWVSEVVDEEWAMARLFPAVIECVEEAVLDSLFRATTVVGRDGHVRHELPVDRVLELLTHPATKQPL